MKMMASVIGLLLMAQIGQSYQVMGNGYNVLGNGGFGVACSTAGHNRLYVLEEYEVMLEIQIADIYARRDVKEINWSTAATLEGQVYEYIQRGPVEMRQPLMKYFKSMRVKFVDDFEPTLFNDTNRTVLNPACVLKPLAIQTQRATWMRPVVHIDEKLWRVLKLRQQAVLMYHETVYGYMIQDKRHKGAKFNSEAARKFVISHLLQ